MRDGVLEGDGWPGRRWGWWVLLFLVHALPFLARPALIGGDEPHYALMAHSLAREGDLELEDDYVAVEQGSAAAGRKRRGEVLDRHLRLVGGRVVPTHPVGLPLLVSPLLMIQSLFVDDGAPDALLLGVSLVVTFLGLLAGWDLLAGWSGSWRTASGVILALYFSTPLWFYSRTFFTEPYLWVFLVIGLWLWWRDRLLLGGLVLGVASILKETALLPVAVLVAARLWERRRLEWRLMLGLGVGASLFLVKNQMVYGSLFETFQTFVVGRPFWGGVRLLFDLRHGLLPFAPLALLALVGWPWMLMRCRHSAMAWGSLMVFCCVFGVTGLWTDWTGGSCYGPRLLVTALPALAVPLVWVVREGGRAWQAVFRASALFGFAIQWSAALEPFTAFWQASVVDLLIVRWLPALSGLVVGWLMWSSWWRWVGRGRLQPVRGKED